MLQNRSGQDSFPDAKPRSFFVTCWIYAIMIVQFANVLGICEISFDAISAQPVWSILNLIAISASTLFVMWGCNDLLEYDKRGLKRAYIGGSVNVIYPCIVYAVFGEMGVFFDTMFFDGIGAFLLWPVLYIKKDGVRYRDVLK